MLNKHCVHDRHAHPFEICDPILEGFEDGVHLECLPCHLPLLHGHAAQRHQLGGVNSDAEETAGAAQNHRSARRVGVELLETHAEVPAMGETAQRSGRFNISALCAKCGRGNAVQFQKCGHIGIMYGPSRLPL